jgi:hypothetical protein
MNTDRQQPLSIAAIDSVRASLADGKIIKRNFELAHKRCASYLTVDEFIYS